MIEPNILINDEALERLHVPIFIKNTDGIYIYCNNAFVDFLGISKKNILGHTAYDIAPTKLAQLYAAADKALLESATHQSYDSSVNTKTTETKVTFRKSVIYTSEHKIAGFVGTIDAHTETKNVGLKQKKVLTPREVEVLSLLVRGQSTKVIASNLGISVHTVVDYLKAIYIKLDVHSKNEALYKVLTLFTVMP